MIQPIGDHILLLQNQAKEQEVGGILLPDSAVGTPLDAKVIALGTGGNDENGNVIEFPFDVGDKVILPPFTGQEVKYEQETYTLVRLKDILAVIKE